MLFKPQTEFEISQANLSASYGSNVVLTASAYLEIINAARSWQYSQNRVVSNPEYHFIDIVPAMKVDK